MNYSDYERGMDTGLRISTEAMDKVFPFTVFEFYGLPGDERNSILWEARAKFRTKEEAAVYMEFLSQNNPRKTYKLEEAKSVRVQAKPSRSVQEKKPRLPKL